MVPTSQIKLTYGSIVTLFWDNKKIRFELSFLVNELPTLMVILPYSLLVKQLSTCTGTTLL
jgi:hypothetical protein